MHVLTAEDQGTCHHHVLRFSTTWASPFCLGTGSILPAYICVFGPTANSWSHPSTSVPRGYRDPILVVHWNPLKNIIILWGESCPVAYFMNYPRPTWRLANWRTLPYTYFMHYKPVVFLSRVHSIESKLYGYLIILSQKCLCHLTAKSLFWPSVLLLPQCPILPSTCQLF